MQVRNPAGSAQYSGRPAAPLVPCDAQLLEALADRCELLGFPHTASALRCISAQIRDAIAMPDGARHVRLCGWCGHVITPSNPHDECQLVGATR